MSAEIIQFGEHPSCNCAAESQQEMERRLEEFLAEVREGKVTGLAIAVSRSSDVTTTYFHYGPKAGHTLTAAAASLFHNVMRHATEG